MSSSTNTGPQHFVQAFSDPAALAGYAERTRRYVPGYDALHQMTAVLLGEKVGADAQILVLGAGGGAELKVLADAEPEWRFVGVDPARPMLDLAEQRLGAAMARVTLVEGVIDDAPSGLFDAAVCLLTLHFLEPGERVRTAREIRRRLKPGAPFVVAHGNLPKDSAARALWLSRYAAHAIASGDPPDRANQARAAVDANVSMLSPEEDEAILRDAGFHDVTLFFAAFMWHGWVAYA